MARGYDSDTPVYRYRDRQDRMPSQYPDREYNFNNSDGCYESVDYDNFVSNPNYRSDSGANMNNGFNGDYDDDPYYRTTNDMNGTNDGYQDIEDPYYRTATNPEDPYYRDDINPDEYSMDDYDDANPNPDDYTVDNYDDLDNDDPDNPEDPYYRTATNPDEYSMDDYDDANSNPDDYTVDNYDDLDNFNDNLDNPEDPYYRDDINPTEYSMDDYDDANPNPDNNPYNEDPYYRTADMVSQGYESDVSQCKTTTQCCARSTTNISDDTLLEDTLIEPSSESCCEPECPKSERSSQCTIISNDTLIESVDESCCEPECPKNDQSITELTQISFCSEESSIICEPECPKSDQSITELTQISFCSEESSIECTLDERSTTNSIEERITFEESCDELIQEPACLSERSNTEDEEEAARVTWDQFVDCEGTIIPLRSDQAANVLTTLHDGDIVITISPVDSFFINSQLAYILNNGEVIAATTERHISNLARIPDSVYGFRNLAVGVTNGNLMAAIYNRDGDFYNYLGIRGIDHISSTHNSRFLWIQLLSGIGYLYNSNLVVVNTVILNPETIIKYGADETIYGTLDRISNTLVMTPSGTVYPNVKDFLIGLDGTVYTLSVNSPVQRIILTPTGVMDVV